MLKLISILVASTLALSVTHTVIAQHSHHEHEIDQEQEKMQKYTCPMHPEVITDHPGNCPKCGMNLVPLKEKKRPTPNSDKSRAGVQRSTSNSEHAMHNANAMA